MPTAGSLYDIEHGGQIPQAVQPHGEILGGLVVHFEVENGYLIDRTGQCRLEDKEAENIGQILEAASAEADAGAPQVQRIIGRTATRRQMFQDGGAGGRHPFAGAAVVLHWKPAQQQHGGRRRYGQHAVGAADPTGPQGQGSKRPARRLQCIDQKGGGDDIRQRIPGADFVEFDRIDGAAMHFSLGLGQHGKDGDGAFLDGSGQAGAPQPVADVTEGRVVMVVTAAIAHHETGALQAVIGMRQAACGDCSGQSRRLQHGGQFAGQFRPGVQQRGDEHVAGYPAERIEMDMHTGFAALRKGNPCQPAPRAAGLPEIAQSAAPHGRR